MFQIAGVINNALASIRKAGAVLVPFDSAAFDELAVSAWPGATADTIIGLDAASNYESIEVLGRCAACITSIKCTSRNKRKHDTIRCHNGSLSTLRQSEAAV